MSTRQVRVDISKSTGAKVDIPSKDYIPNVKTQDCRHSESTTLGSTCTFSSRHD
ncbi:MAG: hypothetical protein JKY23_06090 [Nitrospinaceae bacterium]|nr:hypothetical protein [Nitrospinaceae bacterium]